MKRKNILFILLFCLTLFPLASNAEAAGTETEKEAKAEIKSVTQNGNPLVVGSEIYTDDTEDISIDVANAKANSRIVVQAKSGDEILNVKNYFPVEDGNAKISFKDLDEAFKNKDRFKPDMTLFFSLDGNDEPSFEVKVISREVKSSLNDHFDIQVNYKGYAKQDFDTNSFVIRDGNGNDETDNFKVETNGIGYRFTIRTIPKGHDYPQFPNESGKKIYEISLKGNLTS